MELTNGQETDGQDRACESADSKTRSQAHYYPTDVAFSPANIPAQWPSLWPLAIQSYKMAVARLRRKGRATTRGDKIGKQKSKGTYRHRSKLAARKEIKRKKFEGMGGKSKLIDISA